MNKYVIIGIAVVVIAIALFSTFKALPQSDSPQDDQASTTMATSTAQKNTGAKSTPTSGVKPTTAPSAQSVPASNPSVSAGLQQAFATQGSYRCQWVDRNTGADSLALIKNGRVRVESTALTGEKTIMLYTAVATYLWKEGESSGVLVPKSLSASAQLNSLPTYSDMEVKLRTDDRVKCEQVTINDSHFAVPTNVKFQAIKP